MKAETGKTMHLYDQKYYEMQEFGYANKDRTDHERILEILKPKASDRVLEIGCGFGVLLNRMPSKIKVGIETNDVAVKECKNRGISVIKTNAEKGLPFDDASFDIVIMNEVIEHFKEPYAVLRESWRILSPKGRVVISTPVHSIFAHELSHTHFSEMNIKELKELVEKSGFKITSHEVNNFSFLYPLLENFLYKPFRFLRYAFGKSQKKSKPAVGLIDLGHGIADRTFLKPLNLYRRHFLWLGLNQLIFAQKKANNKF